MDITSIIASIFLIICCLYLILSPFREKAEVITNNKVVLPENEAAKQELYVTLNEIEMDYKMNKLSDKDYQAMKKSYEEVIVGILQKENERSKKALANEKNKDLLQEIEVEIR